MYNTRTQSLKNRSRSQIHLKNCPTKRLRFTDYTETIPEELLIYIFSFVTHEELYKNVRAVCKRWYYVVSTPSLWTKINVDNTVPTELVCKWLEHSPLLKEISLLNRTDVNAIADKMSTCCPNIETVVARNCWGSSKSEVLQGTSLCRLVNKCKKLINFNFAQSRIRSVKFFKLLGRKGVLKKRLPGSYVGPINENQIDALLRSSLRNDDYYLCLTYGNGNKLTVNHCGSVTPALQYFWNTINVLEEAQNLIAEF